jgi:hypothetical protein
VPNLDLLAALLGPLRSAKGYHRSRSPCITDGEPTVDGLNTLHPAGLFSSGGGTLGAIVFPCPDRLLLVMLMIFSSYLVYSDQGTPSPGSLANPQRNRRGVELRRLGVELPPI